MQIRQENDLTARCLQILIDNGQHQHIAPGKTLVREGDAANCLYVILTGGVSVSVQNQSGNMLLSLLKPLDILGEPGLCAEMWHRSATVRARTDTTAVLVPYAKVLQLTEHNAELWSFLLDKLTSRFWATTQFVKQLCSMPAKQHVEAILNDLIERGGEPTFNSHQSVHLSREDLDAFVGCNRKTVSATLRELERQGRLEFIDKHIIQI